MKTLNWNGKPFAIIDDRRDCDCPGCVMSRDPNQGYQPCHRWKDLGEPPQQDSGSRSDSNG